MGTVPASAIVELVAFKLTQLTIGSMLEIIMIGDPWCRTMIGVISVLNVSPGTREMVVSIVTPDAVLDGELLPETVEATPKDVVAGLAAEEATDPTDDTGVRPLLTLDEGTTTRSISTVKVPPTARPPTTCKTIVPGCWVAGTVPDSEKVPATSTRAAQLMVGVEEIILAVMPVKAEIRPVTSKLKVWPGETVITVITGTEAADVLDTAFGTVADEEAPKAVVAGEAAEEDADTPLMPDADSTADDDPTRPLVAADGVATTELEEETTMNSTSNVYVPTGESWT